MATIKLRRDTAANWTSENPVLEQGEVGVELAVSADVPHKIKIGDGETEWSDLVYSHQVLGIPGSDSVLVFKSDGTEELMTSAQLANFLGTTTDGALNAFAIDPTSNGSWATAAWKTALNLPANTVTSLAGKAPSTSGTAILKGDGAGGTASAVVNADFPSAGATAYSASNSAQTELYTENIGLPAVDGSPTANGYTFIDSQRVPTGGIVRRINVYCKTTGTVVLKALRGNANSSVDVLSSQTVTLGSTGALTLKDGTDFTGLYIPRGGYLGIADTGSGHLSYNSTSPTRSYFSPSGNITGNNVGIGVLQTSAELNWNYDIESPRSDTRSSSTGTVLYATDFNIVGQYVVGWADVSASWSLSSSNGLAPGGSPGTNNYFYIDRQFNCSQRTFRVRVKMAASNSRIALATKVRETNYSYAGTIAEFDGANSRLAIYNQWNGGSSTPTVRVTQALPAAVVAGRDYIVELIKEHRTNTIRVTDCVTQQQTTLSCVSTINDLSGGSEDAVYAGGFQWDEVGVMWLGGGSFNVSRAVVTIPQKGPRVVIIGDSITEGYGVTVDQRWATLVANMLPPGAVVISGRGGGKIDGVIAKITSEVAEIRPGFVLVCIGTNGGNTPTKLGNLVTAIKATGAVPIIACIPAMSGGAQASINTDILALGERTVRFDTATAAGNNASGSINSALYISDNLHPNAAGHAVMASQVKIDAPELFY